MNISEENIFQQATMTVTGMTCFRCANTIQKELFKLAGVSDARVNLLLKRASVTYNPAEVTVVQIEQKIKTLGYGAAEMPVDFHLGRINTQGHLSESHNSPAQKAWTKIVSLINRLL